MKKNLIFLFGTVLLLAAAVYCASTFMNTEIFRAKLQKNIETILDRPVRFHRVTLGWSEGVSFNFEDVSLYSEKDAGDSPILNADRIYAVVNLKALLSGKIIFAAVRITNPNFQINRDADGNYGVQGAQNEVKGIWIHDLEKQSGPQLLASRCEIIFRNLVFDRPTEFEIKLALFSRRDNVFLKGRMVLSSKKSLVFERLTMETDLKSWDVEELARAIPAFGDLDLKELAGALKVIYLEGSQVAIDFKNGKTAFGWLREPINQISFSAMLNREGNLELPQLKAKIGNALIFSSVTGQSTLTSFNASLKLQINDLDLEDLAAIFPNRGAKLRGKLSLGFEGVFQGLEMRQILSSLRGEGKLALKEGVIYDFNLLRELLIKLPFASPDALSYLPPAIQNKLALRQMVLGPAECGLRVIGRQILFDNLQLFTEDWNIFSKGWIGFDKKLDIQSWIRINPQFSQAAAQGIPELQYLLNSQGFIEIPVKIDGMLGSIRITPDTQALTSSFMASKGQELITNLIQKTGKKNSLASLF